MSPTALHRQGGAAGLVSCLCLLPSWFWKSNHTVNSEAEHGRPVTSTGALSPGLPSRGDVPPYTLQRIQQKEEMGPCVTARGHSVQEGQAGVTLEQTLWGHIFTGFFVHKDRETRLN